MTTPTAEQQFAGTVGIRTEGVRFEVLDQDLNLLGTLALDRTAVPQITNDVNRTIRRQINNLVVQPRPLSDQNTTRYYAEDLSTLGSRLRPVWMLGTGEEYNLGIFLFGDDSKVLWSRGEPRDCIAVDQMVLLDQDLAVSVGYPTDTVISDALVEQADAIGIGTTRRIIEPSGTVLAEPIAWAAGRDTYTRVFEGLCAAAGFLPPYFDNDGLLVCRAAPDLSTATPEFTYGYGTVVINGSAVKSSDILTAPNRYIAVSSSAQDAAIVGVFDVPDAAPHSFANTGRRITRTISLQGLESVAAAYAAAAAEYARDSGTYTWLQFDTPVDPRHDTFNIFAFDSVNYREQAWSIQCKAGGLMHHDARGTYS